METSAKNIKLVMYMIDAAKENLKLLDHVRDYEITWEDFVIRCCKNLEAIDYPGDIVNFKNWLWDEKDNKLPDNSSGSLRSAMGDFDNIITSLFEENTVLMDVGQWYFEKNQPGYIINTLKSSNHDSSRFFSRKV